MSGAGGRRNAGQMQEDALFLSLIAAVPVVAAPAMSAPAVARPCQRYKRCVTSRHGARSVSMPTTRRLSCRRYNMGQLLPLCSASPLSRRDGGVGAALYARATG